MAFAFLFSATVRQNRFPSPSTRKHTVTSVSAMTVKWLKFHNFLKDMFMRKNILLISTIMLAVMITGIALRSYFKTREQYQALRKPTQNDTKKFLEAIELFKAGKTNGIEATDLRIGPEELKELEKLEWIPYLNLARTTLNNQNVEIVAKLSQLEALDMSETRITDVGLKFFEKHPKLHYLRINKIPMTNKGLESIATIPNLDDLRLWRNSITDEGCKMIAKIENLRIISLDDTMVTDAGIKHLLVLKNLQELKTRGTAVTKNGRDEARKRWPGIRMNPEFDHEVAAPTATVN
jgi:hypothetical protein